MERIQPPSAAGSAAARARLDQLTKPPGSLGALEDLAARLAGITGRERPRFPRKAIFICAADHGVVAQGVSAYPQQVTAQMVANFLAGGAAINVLARQTGARVIIADFGVAADLPLHPDLLDRKIGRGTADFTLGPAMSREDATRAINAGIELLEREFATGLDLAATGEMGIGNTSASTAITAVFTGLRVDALTGRGTGLDSVARAHKVAVLEGALATHRPDPSDPIGVLSAVGGFEIGALVGVMLAGAARQMPVILDGFIAGAAALVAVAICPRAVHYLIASHRSAEPGHRAALEHLQLNPLLDLDLRLGEGTGAAIALHLIDDAVAILDEMATFGEAGVSQRDAAT